MEEVDKGCPMIRMSVSGWVFLLVPAHPGCPGPKAVKWLCVCVCIVWCEDIVLQQHSKMPCCRCKVGICVDCQCASASRTCIDCATAYCRNGNLTTTTSLCGTVNTICRSAHVLVQGSAASSKPQPERSATTDKNSSREQGSAMSWLYLID